VADAGDSAGSARRPNVLFVICDQLRADHLGYAGNPVVRTPHIDSLAATGTVFDRAYVNNPVCMPNRSTIMTGRMPSAHGVIFNDRSLEPNTNTHSGPAGGNEPSSWNRQSPLSAGVWVPSLIVPG